MRRNGINFPFCYGKISKLGRVDMIWLNTIQKSYHMARLKKKINDFRVRSFNEGLVR